MYCLPVACPAVQYFPALFHRRHDFREKAVGYEMCVSIFSINMCDEIFILRRSVRDIIIKVGMLRCPLQLSDFIVS
jgi:hypothetical protein